MIKHIVIEIDGKEFKLTPDKAEKLYDELHKLYGSKNQIPVPFGPYIPPVEPYAYPWTIKPVITYGDGTTITSGSIKLSIK